MSHLAKVLEVLVDSARQGTVHLDINGNIKISRVRYDRVDENLFESVRPRIQMLNENQYYCFDYSEYVRVLRNCIAKKLEGHEIKVQEKHLNPNMAKLLVEYHKQKYHDITNHTH